MARENNCRFFANRSCEYFPCHPGADPDRFNCLFCYCPLYALGPQCGGSFRYLENGIKDCSSCLVPHADGGYDYIIQNYPKLAELARQPGEEPVL